MVYCKYTKKEVTYMLTVSDLKLFSDIFIKELSAIKSAYIRYCSIALCRHYLEDTLLYPVANQNELYYQSSIPMHAKPHAYIRDFLFETVAVGDEGDPGYMTFLEYLYHTWIFFEKAVFNNVQYCLDNYALSSERRERLICICSLSEGHTFYEEIHRKSMDLFADTLTTISHMDFHRTMESVYGDQHKNQLSLRTVLRYRRLPFNYQAFLRSIFRHPPSFISFRTAGSDTIVTWSFGDDVYEYVKTCLRHVKKIQRENGVVVVTNRSAVCLGIETPVRVYESVIYRARSRTLNVVDSKTEVYKSVRLPSGAIKSSLLKKHS